MSDTVLPNRGRVRWHCRRALLELDILFSRFLDKHFDNLTDAQLGDLVELLEYDDLKLWPMVSGREPCDRPHLLWLIETLRSS